MSATIASRVRNPACAACGEKINEDGSHMSFGSFGLSHLKESCLTIMTTHVRTAEGKWDWDVKERIKIEGSTDDDYRVPTEIEGSGEI
ncbi:MAG: hypothetical protein MN733_00150 [Nitrososphaera sp.]|nr:hypothetical protein [Nitrososphaera sp.]